MNSSQLAPDEPLSPELVLVLPPPLRAQALALLGAPAWPAPRPRAPLTPAAADEPLVRSVGVALAARAAQLVLIFVVATVATVAMALVAHAVR